jgi:hypothetical protein
VAVAVKIVDMMPTAAVTVCVPVGVPSVQFAVERPSASVLVFTAVTVPPPDATLHSTRTPGTPRPRLSSARTTSGSASAFATLPCCASPLTRLSEITRFSRKSVVL